MPFPEIFGCPLIVLFEFIDEREVTLLLEVLLVLRGEGLVTHLVVFPSVERYEVPHTVGPRVPPVLIVESIQPIVVVWRLGENMFDSDIVAVLHLRVTIIESLTVNPH